MQFSIVTPTLDADRYIAETLTSVWTQGWPDVQHLVVDGGSTDDTEALVRATRSIWLRQPGLRQSAALNAGFRRATGDIVAWLNADDLYRPGTLAYVAQQFTAKPTIDVVVGDCDMIDATGHTRTVLRAGPYDFRRLLTRGNYIAQPAVFLRRAALERVGYLDETLEFGMDFDLWLKLRGTRVLYTPRVLAAFRWHATSKSANNQVGNWRELLRIVRRHGGGWTPSLACTYVVARLSATRQRTVASLLRVS